MVPYLCIAFLLGAVFIVGLTVVFGESGTAVDNPDTTVLQVPDGPVTEQVIAVSLDRDTVDAFCERQGYRFGYPTIDTGEQYMIACYDDRGGQSVREEFSMFEDFAEYVEDEGDTRG
ncbi:hypothetical protein HT576_09135 [Haloterrigena sp. SYSU A121-1]|uniref:Uncharacterized protein n=1 Tax=Haloterrigena gelatinilytica TaxID=2741724 RepID=A0A8J8KEG3_9EURY|nr:hypothetical protein [Haloterrigena gelatinilytica]NUB91183.1 hypothetical protein [Haloterrigena gelatinilytica]